MQLNFKPIHTLITAASILAVSVGIGYADEQHACKLPQPSAEHAWLQQMVGEWTSETEMFMEPGKPPVKATGTESIRPLGAFWTLSEIKSTMMDKPFTGNFTLGYDTEKKKYVGTWVDSMTGHLWEYEGTVDPTGKILTLETEGICPMNPGKLSKFRETVEIKSPDHKIFSSAIQGPDGNWMTMMTSHAHRK